MAEESAAAGMDIDTGIAAANQGEQAPDASPPGSAAASSSGDGTSKVRFEIKKYNAVALWAWGTSNCSTVPSAIVFL